MVFNVKKHVFTQDSYTASYTFKFVKISQQGGFERPAICCLFTDELEMDCGVREEVFLI